MVIAWVAQVPREKLFFSERSDMLMLPSNPPPRIEKIREIGAVEPLAGSCVALFSNGSKFCVNLSRE
jgi:hypothetical protein